ncbi:MAG: Nramp family divalent metal transporter [Chloroflexota bacterium]|nr:Nramp family divalent metal transporter [Chloroflexota bacterium]
MSPLARRFPRLFLFLAVIGPGLIAANAGNDAGGIATYSAAGARYGYQLLWVLVVITVSLIVVQEMCARLGSVTGMGFTDLVREHFGVRWTSSVVVALLIANFGTAFSEFVGIGAAAELLGIPRLAAIPVGAALLWMLVVFGSYKIVERTFLVMSLAFLSYPVAALLTHPAWGSIGHGLIVPEVPRSFGGAQVVMALIGTTITPYMQLYLQSSVAEKAVRREDYVYVQADVVAGSLFGNFVSLAIIVATAAALYAAGTRDVQTASDAARALEPVAGAFAKTLFAVGLLGACLLAAPVLALTSAYSVTEALGLEKGVSQDFRRAPVFMGLFTGMIVLAAGFALLPGIPFTSTLLLIQIVDGLALPIVLFSLLRLTNDRELMGDRANTRAFNVIGIATVAIVVALSVVLVALTIAQPFSG